MTYEYKGKSDSPLKRGPHVLASVEEAAAKFAYFREAEAKINGGPATYYGEPAPLAPLRPRRDIPECGTNSGYARHIRLKEAPCRPCLDARGHYQRQHRAKKKVIHKSETVIADKDFGNYAQKF